MITRASEAHMPAGTTQRTYWEVSELTCARHCSKASLYSESKESIQSEHFFIMIFRCQFRQNYHIA